MKRLFGLVLLPLAIATTTFADTTTTITTSTPPAATTAPAVESTPAVNVTVQNPAAATFTPDQVIELQKIIHDYLMANPQVLVEVSQELQQQQEKKDQESAMSSISQNKAALFDDVNSPSVGSKTATVTIVEFFDYQCGHCHEMASVVDQLMSQDKNIRFIFKELPIFGAQSAFAAKAALASVLQPGDKYFVFHNALLANKSYSNADVLATAKKVGLNVAKLKKDMNSPAIEQEIRANFTLAQAMKVPGTPAFVIANQAENKFKFIPGGAPLSELQAAVKAVQ